MAILWVKKAKRGAGIRLSLNDAGGIDKSIDDAWLVRCTTQAEDYEAIALAPGVVPGDTIGHSVCQEISAKPVANNGLLWLVSPKWARRNPVTSASGESGMPADDWSASGSGSSVPVFYDAPSDPVATPPQVIRNTAGDPVEGLTKDESDFTLSLTKAFATHTEWMNLAESHRDHTNNATWHGKPAETWLCRFLNAQLHVASGSDGNWLVYWLSRWEFAHNVHTWRARPPNIGYQQLVDGSRRVILGDDGKPARSPVALDDYGVAKAATDQPDVLKWWWRDGSVGVPVCYTADFSVFGEISTPAF